MRKTSLDELHIKLGAKMIPFVGYNIPVQFEGIKVEHDTIRNSAGVFDVSHMEGFITKGSNAITLIQKTSINDASRLFDGKVQYSYMSTEHSDIVDNLLVYRINGQDYMPAVNASNIEKNWNWNQANKRQDISLNSSTDKTSLLTVQGLKELEVLQKLATINPHNLTYCYFEILQFTEISHITISATGCTCTGEFEVYFPNSETIKIRDVLFEANKDAAIKPIRSAVRDTLRPGMRYCLYGNDINAEIAPLEVGLLAWITKFT